MSKINIKPLADRVLILPAAAETKTSSGIIVSGFRKNKNSPLANFAALLLALENPMLFSDLISFKL